MKIRIGFIEKLYQLLEILFQLTETPKRDNMQMFQK